LHSSTYQAIFGVIDIDLNALDTSGVGIISSKNLMALRNDLMNSGMVNPIDVEWNMHEKPDKLVVTRGNHRVQVLKDIGAKRAPCYLKIKFHEYNEDLIGTFKKILPFIKENKGSDNNFKMDYKPTNLHTIPKWI